MGKSQNPPGGPGLGFLVNSAGVCVLGILFLSFTAKGIYHTFKADESNQYDLCITEEFIKKAEESQGKTLSVTCKNGNCVVTPSLENKK